MRLIKFDVKNFDFVIGTYSINHGTDKTIYISHYDATRFNSSSTPIPVYYYNGTDTVVIGKFNKYTEYEHTATTDTNFNYMFNVNSVTYVDQRQTGTTFGVVNYRQIKSLISSLEFRTFNPWCVFIPYTVEMSNIIGLFS